MTIGIARQCIDRTPIVNWTMMTMSNMATERVTHIRRALLCIVWLLTGALASHAARAQERLPIPDIPHEKFVLSNGLTVVIHEDRKSPIVAVNVWYHVGSKNEPAGRTGFAHLFEHLMFNGSEHYDDDYFKPFTEVGATEMNGTTNADRTNYFQNVPVTALDLALWMESDRMCCMNAAVDQAKLDEQRGVVQNEKRQGENRPYGEVFNLIQENTYPEGHPYDHTVIGSMADLNSASLADVHEWFDSYYGPNNATLVIAGAVDTKTALAKVKHYFGGIKPGPPLQRQEAWVAKRTGTHRQIFQDRVPQAQLNMVWNVPELTHPTAQYLALFADILANGKNSRVYRKLVYERRIATDVSAFVLGRELGSLFILSATAAPEQATDELQKAIRSEMRQLLDNGFTAEELERARTTRFADFIRGVERIGGFDGKSDVLAASEVYYGAPDGYRRALNVLRDASERNVMEAARAWLQDGDYILEVEPYPKLSATQSELTRDEGPPIPKEFPSVDFPEYERAQLPNGLDILVAHRAAAPVVEMSLLVDAGYAADQGGTLGTASLTLNMMDEGAGNRDALQIAAEMRRLGANIELESSLDASSAALSALKANLEPSLALFADIVLHPTFPASELERLRALQSARIRQEQADPFSLALRIFPQLVYENEHPYAIPFTGTGTLESVASLTRADLLAFHGSWFKPNNATLIVVGDTRMNEMLPLLEKHFGGWNKGDVPSKPLGAEPRMIQSVVYVVDRPGSQQSIIVAGHVVPPYSAPDKLSLDAANEVLGGSFTARLNMNLREDKHWSYGARSIIVDARGSRPFFAYAPVQSDQTAASMKEIQRELTELAVSQPPTAAEVGTVQNRKIRALPGRWETAGAVLAALGEIVSFGLDANYWDTYPERIRALDVIKVKHAAREHIHPENLVWIVVGDWSRVEKDVRALGLGSIERVDMEDEVGSTGRHSSARGYAPAHPCKSSC